MSDERNTTLLIIEEQDLLRQGIENVFGKADDFSILGSTADVSKASKLVGELKPNVVVLGLHETFDGAGICGALAKSNSGSKILLLTAPGNETAVVEAFKKGASACLLTDVMTDDLIQTMRMVARGQMVVPQNMANKGLVERRRKRRNPPNLSLRELEVLQLMANGLRNKDIATELCISEVTVKTHVSRIFRKLNKNNRTAAILHGHQNGWICLTS